ADKVVRFTIPAPIMWDSSAIEGEREDASFPVAANVSQRGDKWQMTLIASQVWLQDAARVYPVYVDPTLTAGDSNFYAYKSDGATRSDAVHVGNSRDGGTNKYWRTIARYSTSSVASKQV